MGESAGTRPDTSVAVSSVEALLALHDVAFVRSAYLNLLGREADPDGLEAYVAQVRAGVDKAHIVAVLAASDEGRQRRAALPGLDEILRRHNRPDRSWFQRVTRRFARRLMQPSQEPSERLLRAIDNRLYRLELELANQLQTTRQLQHDLAQLTITVNGLRQPSPASAALPPLQGSAPATVAVALPRQVPPRVEQVFRELKQGLARSGSHAR